MDFIVIDDILLDLFEILIRPVKKEVGEIYFMQFTHSVLDFSSLCDALAAVCDLRKTDSSQPVPVVR